MERDLKHSQERGKGLEGKFRASSRALRVEPELSASWRQKTIVHRSLAKQRLFRPSEQRTRVKRRDSPREGPARLKQKKYQL